MSFVVDCASGVKSTASVLRMMMFSEAFMQRELEMSASLNNKYCGKMLSQTSSNNLLCDFVHGTVDIILIWPN